MADTHIRSDIGVLRSEKMALQIHTKQAVKLLYRNRINNKYIVLGLTEFLTITNRMFMGSRQGDPYSDWFMIQVEEKLDEVNSLLIELKKDVDAVFLKIPPAFTVTESLNVQPLNLPIISGNQLGYLAVFIIAKYDEIARKALLAHHIALVGRATLDEWLYHRGSHHIRSLFTLPFRYRYTGITREDLEQRTAAATTAIERYGQVPDDVLTYAKRSRFSPIRISHTHTSEAKQEAELVNNEDILINNDFYKTEASDEF